jgi:alpha-glucosidase
VNRFTFFGVLCAFGAMLGGPALSESQAEVQQAGSVTGVVQAAAANGTTNYFFELEGGQTLAILPYSDDVIRVRWHWDGLLNKADIAIAKEQPAYDPVPSTLQNLGDRYRIATDLVWIEIPIGGPAKVDFRHPNGHLLLEDDKIEYDTSYEPINDTSYNNLRYDQRDAEGFKVKNSKVAPPDEAYFGLGEYSGPANRRGERVQMWNSDAFSWREGGSPMYKSFPFYYGVRPAAAEHDGFTYGVFFNNSSRTIFRMGSEFADRVSFEGGDAPLDYFFFGGGADQTMATVLAQYTELTGPSPMLPRWAYGYHMSKFSYGQDDVIDVVSTFRSNNIPLDSIYLDLDYFYQDIENYGNNVGDPNINYDNNLFQLTWNSAFPDPQAMTAFCHTQGVRVVAMVEPWLVPDDPKYDFVNSNSWFVDDNNGNTVLTDIWMGPSSWMDFTDGNLRSWWRDQVATFFQDAGIDGIWNDLNETADDGQIPLNGLYALDGAFGTDNTNSVRWHQSVKNTHAIYQTSVSYGALQDAFPNQRPFVLSRGGFPGIQRYAAGWSGDNIADYNHLRHNIRTGVSAMMSGMVNYGHDIGGFVENSTPELLARWHEWGVLNPFCRNHYSKFDPPKEPYRYDGVFRDTIIESVRFRYRLMPYLYTLAEQSTRNGMPMNTPTVMHFPQDTNTFHLSDNDFMVGDFLLAAPVFQQGTLHRTVYLPDGADWYHWHTGERYSGGDAHTVYAPMGRLPLFARAGSIVPLGPDVQTLDNYRPEWLELRIWPADGVQFTLYEDDGMSYDYLSNGFARTTFDLAQSVTGMVLSTSREGAYDTGTRSLHLRFEDVSIWTGDTVRLNGVELTDYTGDSAGLDASASGWLYDLDSRTLEVKVPDDPAGLSVEVSQRDATDTDGDGMPDWWETAFGLNPLLDDAAADPDGDQATNLEEYRRQSDPFTPEPIFYATELDNLTLVGPFNSWNPSLTNMTLIDDYLWATELTVTNVALDRFKFAANGNYDLNWGETNQLRSNLPLQALAETNANDISISGTQNGTYRFTFNEQSGIYTVTPLPGVDTDGDGIPDDWEIQYGLNPRDPTDADSDMDGDGLTAYQEYLAGSDPTQSSPRQSAFSSMTIAGDFTGWNAEANNMMLVGNGLWQYETVFQGNATIRFKITANGSFDTNWGDNEQLQTIAPLDGQSDLNGAGGVAAGDIIANITGAGAYRFTFNENTLAYSLKPIDEIDTDADGIPDSLEIAYGLDPNDPTDAAQDASGDGLSNRLKILAGLDPMIADNDGDGASDADEWLAGTDPLNPEDALIGMAMPNPAAPVGVWSMVWPTVTGRTYTLISSTNLIDANSWSNVAAHTDFSGTGGPVQIDLENQPSNAFYRLKVDW